MNKTYSKSNGHHCFWLNINGNSVANFDHESDVDDIIKMSNQLRKLKLNKFILTLIKWFEDEDSVTPDERIENKLLLQIEVNVLTCITYAVGYAAAGDIEESDENKACAKRWVDIFFKRTGEDKQVYLDHLKGEL